MPPLLVRLNLPGFSSPEPHRLANAPATMAGLACAVLEEIGGFSQEELDGVRRNVDQIPLRLYGELCAGQLVELASDTELQVFLDTAESPRRPAIIEVRPRDVDVEDMDDAVVAGSPMRNIADTPPAAPTQRDNSAPSPEAAVVESASPAPMSQVSPVSPAAVGQALAAGPLDVTVRHYLDGSPAVSGQPETEQACSPGALKEFATEMSSVDEVRQEDLTSYAHAIAKKLSGGHDAVRKAISEFIETQGLAAAPNGSVASNFAPFEFRTGSDIERILVDISVRRHSNGLQVSYKTRNSTLTPSHPSAQMSDLPGRSQNPKQQLPVTPPLPQQVPHAQHLQHQQPAQPQHVHPQHVHPQHSQQQPVQQQNMQQQQQPQQQQQQLQHQQLQHQPKQVHQTEHFSIASDTTFSPSDALQSSPDPWACARDPVAAGAAVSEPGRSPTPESTLAAPPLSQSATLIPTARKERTRTPDSTQRHRGGQIATRLRGGSGGPPGSGSSPALGSPPGPAPLQQRVYPASAPNTNGARLGPSSSGDRGSAAGVVSSSASTGSSGHAAGAVSSSAATAPSTSSTSAGASVPAAQAATSSTSQTRPPASVSASCERPLTTREGPAYMRLYQEKDARRLRHEEAQRRRLEQEEEDIRVAAQKALGRNPSPSRSGGSSAVGSSSLPPWSGAQSPDRPTSPTQGASRGGRDAHPRTSGTNSGANTPPRQRPPLPERPSSTGTRSRGRRTAPSYAEGQTNGHVVASSSTSASVGRAAASGSPTAGFDEVADCGAGPLPHPSHCNGSTQQLLQNDLQDASSLASDSIGPRADPGGGLQRDASLGTIGCEDSLYGDGVASTSSIDAQSLRQLVLTQQQRIEFLEHMHQQALRQLQKCRDELAKEQQRRLQEADKALRLEQLMSEMQVQRFEGDAQMQLRWEEWLQRTRTILDTD